MSSRTTVVIPAHNAETTVARAVTSACVQHAGRLLLVDHACTDGTVAEARRAAGPAHLTVVSAPAAATIGGVRQVGLESVETPYGVWLDADDELLAGRVDRMERELDGGADIVADAAELWDGRTGRPLGILEMPAFLRASTPPVRLFERNYLPGDAVVGFRAAAVRRVGYDRDMHGPEGIDLLLRAIRAGLRLRLHGDVGYRFHAYPASLSRGRARQRAMYARCLRKFEPGQVADLYAAAGAPTRVTGWALWSIAMFCDDVEAAAAHLETLESERVAPGTVLEPDGPDPRPEGWRTSFARGTVEVLRGAPAIALRAFDEAERHLPTAEGANNRGVALAALGRHEEARASFAAALARFDGYADAAENAASASPTCVTTHPLRTRFARTDYAAGRGADARA